MANVKTTSKGYNYNYASLGDIVEQGYELPKMTTGTDEATQKEYVYYFDTDLNTWLRGAEVVIPENSKMNKAQNYGSALTYARRYTTLMALSLACSDDKNIETEEKEKIFDTPPITELVNKLNSLMNVQEKTDFLNAIHLVDMNKIPTNLLIAMIDYYDKKHNTTK